MERVLMRSAVLVLALSRLVLTAFGAVPQTMNVQGKLTDAGGRAVAGGSYSVVFTIYDAASAGTNLWTETSSVTASGGVFSTIIGAITPLADSAFDNQNLWLGLKIETDPEMTPRQQLTSVPFAMSPPVPIAFASIDNATVRSGWPVGISVVWDPSEEAYKITIPGVFYLTADYVTVVTPITLAPVTVHIEQAFGALVVYLTNPAGTSVQGRFQFVTYKP